MQTYEVDSEISLDRVVLYLGAKWCGPCKRYLPEYRTFAQDYCDDFDVNFYYVDIDAFSSPNDILTSEVQNTESVPTVLVYLKNKLVQKISPWNRDELYKAMHEYFIEGNPVDNSKYAVIANRVLDDPSGSDNSEDEFDFELPPCDIDGCCEIPDDLKVGSIVKELPDMTILKIKKD